MRKGESKIRREKEHKRELCVCVCVREREREFCKMVKQSSGKMKYIRAIARTFFPRYIIIISLAISKIVLFQLNRRIRAIARTFFPCYIIIISLAISKIVLFQLNRRVLKSGKPI